MMQAAARSYRLNQTHRQCKTIYLYYEGTMEATAVQLMSRKQRAAKLLTGELGLTGLEALTDGEGGLEEALMDAIGKDDALIDPSALFKTEATVIDVEDQAFWAAEIAEPVIIPQVETPVDAWAKLTDYLENIHLIYDDAKRELLQSELRRILQAQINQPDLVGIVSVWLKDNRFVFAGCEDESAQQIVKLAQQTLDVKIVQLDAHQPKVKPTHKHDPSNLPDVIPMPKIKPKRKRQRKAVSDDAPVQLALF